MIDPTPYKMTQTKKRLCIIDTETDPFAPGQSIAPFCVGFLDLSCGCYFDFWGDDCVKRFFDWLATYAPADELLVYAHNGGKFDFFFFWPHLDKGQDVNMIAGRIVRATFQGVEFRDSYAIIPTALSAYNKDVIDYAHFKRHTREQHKGAILAYLKSDCVYLGDLVREFHDMFGDKLTIGGVAIAQLKSFHGFHALPESEDAFFRRFYFGGRVQCFEIGTLHDDWQIFDVTSMYPSVMRDFLHPVGRDYKMRAELHHKAHFAEIVARNYGALPARTAQGGLSFDIEHGTFFATMHEIEAGLETGTLEIERVNYSITFDQVAYFNEFVDHFFGLRQLADRERDPIKKLFYKLILNSAYGKFAQDPRKYRDYAIGDHGPPETKGGLKSIDNPKGWELDTIYGDDLVIWKAELDERSIMRGLKNVATAASITGAARAQLLRGLSSSERPIYCDTDSLICKSFAGKIGSNLGEWKREGQGDVAHIAGKKLYTVYDGKELVKCAAKGARIDASDIGRVADGETISHLSSVPNFKRDGRQVFVERKIRATGKASRFGK